MVRNAQPAELFAGGRLYAMPISSWDDRRLTPMRALRCNDLFTSRGSALNAFVASDHHHLSAMAPTPSVTQMFKTPSKARRHCLRTESSTSRGQPRPARATIFSLVATACAVAIRCMANRSVSDTWAFHGCTVGQDPSFSFFETRSRTCGQVAIQ